MFENPIVKLSCSKTQFGELYYIFSSLKFFNKTQYLYAYGFKCKIHFPKFKITFTK